MLLDTVQEKIYYRCVREHSQRQGPLEESRVDMTLTWAMLGAEERKDERVERGTRRPKSTERAGSQNGWII